MSDGFQFYDIIFFALIAIFIILRLRGVLGRRTGQHRQRHPDRFARTEQPPEESQGQGPSQGQGEVVQLPDRTRPVREAPQDMAPQDEEPEPAAEQSTSLRDLPEDVWQVRRPRVRRPIRSDEDAPGRIRFAEDIAGLRGGVTASRRNRRRPDQQGPGNSGGGRRRRPTRRRR